MHVLYIYTIDADLHRVLFMRHLRSQAVIYQLAKNIQLIYIAYYIQTLKQEPSCPKWVTTHILQVTQVLISTHLEEADVVGVLAEALTAHVEVVLADQAVGVVAHAAVYMKCLSVSPVSAMQIRFTAKLSPHDSNPAPQT